MQSIMKTISSKVLSMDCNKLKKKRKNAWMNLFGTKAVIDWKCEFGRGDNEHNTN
jgi:hypothetical protein